MKVFGPIVRLTATLIVVCGLLYPLVVTGISLAAMPKQANGSLVYNQKHQVIGSELIGQNFKSNKYFYGRVSSINDDASGSGSPNYAPSNPDLLKRVKKSVEDWKKTNPGVPVSQLPVDLITNSGSGLDPDISPDAAYAQVSRVSQATGLSEKQLKQLVKKHIENPSLGFLGEQTVNVLELNLDLNKLLK